MSDERPHATMCRDIEPVFVAEREVTLTKAREQSDYTTFVAWVRNEARKQCEHGYCPKGKCRGHAEISDWELLSESDEEFTCRFSAEIFCRCE